jgi:hypothetical protein
MQLSPLEEDILGELAWDSHGVGELAGFVRASQPELDDPGVFRLTRALLATWIERGWLALASDPRPGGGLSSIEDLLPYLDRHGPRALAVDGDVELPEVDLTLQAFRDVAWLRGAG